MSENESVTVRNNIVDFQMVCDHNEKKLPTFGLLNLRFQSLSKTVMNNNINCFTDGVRPQGADNVSQLLEARLHP